MINFERISSGIEGLDTLLHGGLIKNSINSIVGSSGTGKTTFALAYIYRGLIDGDHVLYLSFEEGPSKLVAEAKSLGINLEKAKSDVLEVIHLVESDKIVEFMTEILPALAKKLKNKNVKHTRIVLDPLTPILWEFPSEKEQRKILTKVYRDLRGLGTVLQTVEEPNAFGQTDIGANETRVPIYLSDMVAHIQNLGLGGKYNRTCKIIKSRKTAHYEGIFPLEFVYGPGILIDTQDTSVNNAKDDFTRKEIREKLNNWLNSKEEKMRIIAEIGLGLLSKQNKRNMNKNIELVKALTDSKLVNKVKI